MKITSVKNELVKETAKLQQRKYRDEKGLFLLEGEKCVDEAIRYGIDIERIFVSQECPKYNNYEVFETTEAVMKKISTTISAPKIIAVAKKNDIKWNSSYKNIILLDGIKDAGNLGTIIRTACAFNVDAIILYGETVDLYNPKCVRSTVGNLWKVPVYNVNNFDELKNLTKDYTPIATLPKSDNTVCLQDYIQKDKQMIMFGTEADGLCSELKNYAQSCGESLTIEMSDRVESLNLSISAGIVLYKLFAKYSF